MLVKYLSFFLAIINNKKQWITLQKETIIYFYNVMFFREYRGLELVNGMKVKTFTQGQGAGKMWEGENTLSPYIY